MMQIHRQGCYWKERSNAPLFSDLARSEWCWKKIFHILIIVLMDRILHMILPNQEMCVFHILFVLHHRALSYIQSCRFSDWPQFNDLFVEVISLRLLNAVFTFLLIGFLQPSALWLHWSAQIIATSHDLTPNGGLVREIPLFQGNLGWWNIIIWPDWYTYTRSENVTRVGSIFPQSIDGKAHMLQIQSICFGHQNPGWLGCRGD